jgi:hypothetical protein
VISGIHWGSWIIFPKDKKELLNTIFLPFEEKQIEAKDSGQA